MPMAQDYEKKKEKKSIKESASAEEEKKKERLTPYSVKDFVLSKYGIPLLKTLEEPFKQRHRVLTERKDKRSLYKHMRALVNMYTSWAKSSPLCGNKRTRMYTLLKEIEVVAKTQKEPLPSTTSASPLPIPKERSPPTDKITPSYGQDSESMDTFFDNTTYNMQSFSLLDTTQTETDTRLDTTQTSSISDLLDISNDSSDSIMIGRRRSRGA
ncbi:hypothetical protein NEAUS04_0748 [Nematocida ausubeli]|nr:hypothetical protein NEAUS04_0091 [Nematocida ausubeli]KAI5161863.1 hypothetical protein NEAUS04_0748 [Nematocida ausubeli]